MYSLNYFFSSSVLNINKQFIITDRLISLCHISRVMQRVVGHTYVGLYIYQLSHRRSNDYVAQFCVNTTHCREFPLWRCTVGPYGEQFLHYFLQ